jgi:uncharacterized protein YndB with AHSA1/START domain
VPAVANTFDVACPPEQVYAYVTDPSRFPEWQADVVSVTLHGTGLGSRFTTTRRIGRSERRMIQEVTEIDPPRSWAARGVDGPIRPSATLAIEPLDGGARSRVTIALDFEGHGIGVPLVPMVRRMAAKGAPMSYRTLTQRLESGAA